MKIVFVTRQVVGNRRARYAKRIYVSFPEQPRTGSAQQLTAVGSGLPILTEAFQGPTEPATLAHAARNAEMLIGNVPSRLAKAFGAVKGRTKLMIARAKVSNLVTKAPACFRRYSRTTAPLVFGAGFRNQETESIVVGLPLIKKSKIGRLRQA